MGTISPKGGVVRCYFGVSPRKIIIMDEKTKVQYCTKLCQSKQILFQHWFNIIPILVNIYAVLALSLGCCWHLAVKGVKEMEVFSR